MTSNIPNRIGDHAWSVRLHHPSRPVLGVYYLDSDGRPLGQSYASHHRFVDPSETALEARRLGASALLLFQHRPSGIGSVGPADRALTDRIKTAAEASGLHLLDHLIVAEPGVSASLASGDWSRLPCSPRENA